MLVTQIVRCPDCGSMAQRHFHVGVSADKLSESSSDGSQVISRTECHDCDYFLEICMTTGQVLASHIAPVYRCHHKSRSLSAPASFDETLLQMQPG